MSAERLREAAALMRERAMAATPGGPRWETAPDEMHGPSQAVIFPADSDSAIAFAGADNAEYIASWHPAVALAVANWLDLEADCDLPADYDPAMDIGRRYAERLADAYLGAASC